MSGFTTCCVMVAVLLMGIAPVTASGQELDNNRESPFTLRTHERIHWGLIAGITGTLPFFKPEVTPSFTRSAGVGWMIAGRGLVKINRRSYGLVQLGYSRAVSQFGSDSLHNKLKMDLAELSLRFCRRYSLSKASDLFVGVGPTIKYWISSSGTLNSPYLSTDYTTVLNGAPDASTTMYLNNVNRVLFGIELSVGVTTPFITGEKLMFEVNTAYMLTPLGGDGSYSAFYSPWFPKQFEQQQLDQRLLTVTASMSYLFGYNPKASRLGKSTKEKEVKKRDPRKVKKDKAYLNTRLKKKPKE